MPLSSLQVFNDQVYLASSEKFAQEINKFNEGSAGTLILRPGDMQGDYKDQAMWQMVSGMVRRRSITGTGSVTAKNLAQIADTMVKVAAGTTPMEINPSQFTWINKSPEEAGLVIGEQMAEQMLADMLNTTLGALVAAMVQTTAIYTDLTAATPDTITLRNLNKIARPLGDRAQAVSAWVMHSTQYHDLTDTTLANSEALFSFGSTAIYADHLGRPFIVTDSPNLVLTAPTPDEYYVLGLVPGAAIVEQNNDFMANIATTNGKDNIERTYQAEWTFNIGIKGYAWDKTNGGRSPSTAALTTSTNWDKYITSDKDGPGVIGKVN